MRRVYFYDLIVPPHISLYSYLFFSLPLLVSSFTVLSAADGVPVQKDGEQVSRQQLLCLTPLVNFPSQWTLAATPEEPTWPRSCTASFSGSLCVALKVVGDVLMLVV